jgi:hypothetical protein
VGMIRIATSPAAHEAIKSTRRSMRSCAALWDSHPIRVWITQDHSNSAPRFPGRLVRLLKFWRFRSLSAKSHRGLHSGQRVLLVQPLQFLAVFGANERAHQISRRASEPAQVTVGSGNHVDAGLCQAPG